MNGILDEAVSRSLQLSQLRGFEPDVVAHLLGLSQSELQRYFGIGLIKITPIEDDHSGAGEALFAVEMGNRVLSVTFQEDRLVRHDMHYLRGKKFGCSQAE